MKFICTSDFPNPQGEVIKLTGDQKHLTDANGKELKNHIHEGAVFNIGSATEFAQLSPSEKTLVAQLKTSGKITEATDAAVKRITEKVKLDESRKVSDTTRDAVADPLKGLADPLKGLADIIAKVVEQNAAILAAIAKSENPKK